MLTLKEEKVTLLLPNLLRVYMKMDELMVLWPTQQEKLQQARMKDMPGQSDQDNDDEDKDEQASTSLLDIIAASQGSAASSSSSTASSSASSSSSSGSSAPDNNYVSTGLATLLPPPLRNEDPREHRQVGMKDVQESNLQKGAAIEEPSDTHTSARIRTAPVSTNTCTYATTLRLQTDTLIDDRKAITELSGTRTHNFPSHAGR